MPYLHGTVLYYYNFKILIQQPTKDVYTRANTKKAKKSVSLTFAVAAQHDHTATPLIKNIDSHMSIDIKDIGLLNWYNGIDITQAKHYNIIKNSNKTL